MTEDMTVTLWNAKTAPRIGIGTWVMGGEQYWGDQPTGWSDVDDATSIRTLHRAFDLGVRIIDTADQYGAGRAERVIAQAIASSTLPRDAFTIATKVGMVCDPETGNLIGITDDADDIERAIDASLVRLGVEQIDLVKFHLNRHPVEQSQGVFEAFGRAYEAGKIAGFGWSTDDVSGATAFADLPGYVAVQHDLNLFSPADDMLRALEARGLWSFNRQPLAMGLLTGKYRGDSPAFGRDDIRGSGAEWLAYFNKDGSPSAAHLAQLEALRQALTSDGRTLAQGALGWCLAQSDRTIPLPGCRTPKQATDNFGVIERGPLGAEAMAEVTRVLRT